MIKKILLFLVGGTVLAVFSLWLFFAVAFRVGYLNFYTSYWTLSDIAEQAHAMPIKPGETFTAEMKDGVLVRTEYATTSVSKDAESRLFVQVYRGGGHIGSQGYVYSSDSDFKVPESGRFPLAESYHYRRMSFHWWSYDHKDE